MEFVEYTIHGSCFPRYHYTKKVRKGLIKRYNKLRERTECNDVFLCEEIVDSFSIVLSKSCLAEEKCLDIMSVFSGNAEVEITKTSETGDLHILFKKKSFNTNPLIIISESHFVHKRALLRLFPGQIIILENEKAVATHSKISKEKENIYICLEENLRQVISAHLERYAFTGMKKVCGFLESVLFAADSRNKHVQVELSKQNVKRTKKDEENDLNTKRPQSLKENHHRNSIIRLAELCKENKDIKETTERLVDEIVGMFNRSQLPVDEHPDLRKRAEESINEKLSQDLRKLSPRIRSYGYRFRTFQVYVDCEAVTEEFRNDIAETLKRHKITEYSVVTSHINFFASCCVGSKVSVESNIPEKTNTHGTLGVFARTSSGESERLWVLMSRHVAECSVDDKVYIKDGKEYMYVAKVMNGINDHETEKPYLDIAAACLGKDAESSCDTMYVTENNAPVKGMLCIYDAEKLKGLPVHIRGASTPIGFGTITVPKQNYVQANGTDEKLYCSGRQRH